MWAYVVAPLIFCNTRQARNSWIHLTTCSYRPILPRQLDQTVLKELTLSHHAPTGASAFVPDPLASSGGFHLKYNDADSVTLSDEPPLLAVSLICSSGSPALTGHYLVEILPQLDLVLPKNCFRHLGDRSIPVLPRPTLNPATFWESPTPH